MRSSTPHPGSEQRDNGSGSRPGETGWFDAVLDGIENPLATIVATLQGVIAFWPGQHPASFSNGPVFQQRKDPEEMLEDLRRILVEARRAAELVSSARDTPQPQPRQVVTVGSAIVGLERRCRTWATANGIRIAVDPGIGSGSADGVIRGDAAVLDQMLLMVLMEVQAALGGGTGEVAITLESKPGWAWLTVRVSGKADVPRLASGAGAGLGAFYGPLVDDIARSLDGKIDRVTGKSGCHEVTISFATPLPSTHQTRTKREPGETLEFPGRNTAPDGGKPARVLVVDDQENVRRSVGRFLARSGFAVDEAADGLDALDKLRVTTYGAIVSDLRMPGFSGEQLYAAIQEELPEMASRVIFSSGDMMRCETIEFLESTGCPALQKPYELAELVAAIQSVSDDTAPQHGGENN